MPRVEKVWGDSVYGYWEPGWIEFEMYVGKPSRDLHGVYHDPETVLDLLDTLTEPIRDSPEKKGQSFSPFTDEAGNVWKRRGEWQGSTQTHCPLYTLLRNDTVLYGFRDCMVTEAPGMYYRTGHWWIETWDYKPADDTRSNEERGKGFQIIADGEFLSDKYHCSETFDYHYVNDQPFFMFRRDSLWGWNYDGVETVTDFDDFFHGGCCELGCANPRFYADDFSFYARRDSVWYLVVGTMKEK
ncbi:MAG TPA: hypothetical protein VGL38_05640 [bacterium]